MYSVKTRTCAVKIFNSLLKAININITNKEQKNKLLSPVLPIFIEKLIGSLANPSGQYSSFALKTEIIKGSIFLKLFSLIVALYLFPLQFSHSW